MFFFCVFPSNIKFNLCLIFQSFETNNREDFVCLVKNSFSWFFFSFCNSSLLRPMLNRSVDKRCRVDDVHVAIEADCVYRCRRHPCNILHRRFCRWVYNLWLSMSECCRSRRRHTMTMRSKHCPKSSEDPRQKSDRTAMLDESRTTHCHAWTRSDPRHFPTIPSVGAAGRVSAHQGWKSHWRRMSWVLDRRAMADRCLHAPAYLHSYNLVAWKIVVK